MALQLALPGRTPLPDEAGLAARRPRQPMAYPIPEYPAILRAPVFAPDRAPGEVSFAGSSAPVIADSLQVMGVALAGRAASAVIRAPDGVSYVLKPGQTLQGWRLVSVAGDAAIFDGPSGRTTLAVGAPPPTKSKTEAGPSGHPALEPKS